MLDTVRTEVIGNALRLVTEEMGVAVVRSSFSSFIQESVEASASILDSEGRLLSAGHETNPLHSSSLRCGIRSIIEDFPLEAMQPGDVYVMNDPFRGGIHSNDLLVLRPVFADAHPAYFTGTLVHVADLGGAAAGGLPANATDFFGEGLLLPPVPLYIAGEENADVVRILSHNTRMPENLLGDIRGLVAGANVGAVRMQELLERFGVAPLAEAVESLLDQSAQLMEHALRAVPDGTYEGGFDIDDDGSGDPREYAVRVTLTVEDGKVDVSFAGTSPQARGIINAAYSQVLGSTLFGLRACVGMNLPLNEGSFRPLTIDLPLGTLVNPRSPAACNGRIVTCTAIIEAIVSALSKAREELAMAASGIVHIYTLGGSSPDTRQWGYLGVEMGGSGARFGMDGPDASSAAMFGSGRSTTDVEPLEARYPILVERAGLLRDSGGAGEWRGGMGTETVVRVLSDARVTVRTDRVRLAPPGLDGGRPGVTGGYAIRRASGRTIALPGKAMNVPMEVGDALIMRTTGGGGVGSPHRRERQLVLEDLRSGAVSRSAAEAIYGVGLNGASDARESGGDSAMARRRNGK
jgi:N-methylhydantoinase B